MARRGRHDELPDGCGLKACYLCRVFKTIRIAESSDMDNWETVLRPCASFKKGFEFFLKRKMKWRLFPTPIPMDRYEVVG